jgi:hypothetical protein
MASSGALGGAGAAPSGSSSMLFFLDDTEKEISNVRVKCPDANFIHVLPDPTKGVNDAEFRSEMLTNMVYQLILANPDLAAGSGTRKRNIDPISNCNPAAGINQSHIDSVKSLIGDKTGGTIVFDWDFTLNINDAFYYITKYVGYNASTSELYNEAYVELLCGGKTRVQMLRDFIKVCNANGFRKIVLTSSNSAKLFTIPPTEENIANVAYFKSIVQQLLGPDTEVYHTAGPFPTTDEKLVLGADGKHSYDKGASFQALGLCPIVTAAPAKVDEAPAKVDEAPAATALRKGGYRRRTNRKRANRKRTYRKSSIGRR